MTQGDQGISHCPYQCSSRRRGAKGRRRRQANRLGARPVPALYAAEPLEQRLLLAVLYVDLNAPGLLHDGASWDSAYVDLQPALGKAQAGDQIRIAGGTYKPTADADRTQSFQLKSGVALYGGYGGHNAPNPDQRNVQLFPTILSGEIGDPGTREDNSYHVVYAEGVDATAILDGLTITAGNANGTTASRDVGGGMLNYCASPTLVNCTFSRNSGGGMYNLCSSPKLTNCSFVGNSTSGSGGGMYNFSSSPTLTNCSFVGNSADRSGGGLYNYGSSSPTLTNCILWYNDSGICNDNDRIKPSVSYSLIQGGFIGIGNFCADPLFVRSPWPGPDGVFATADDDYGDLRLRADSPALNVGSNAAVPAEFTTDLAGNARIQDGTVDLGVYEGAVPVPTPRTIYVDQNATGTNTGASWADAYTNLQSALAASVDSDTIRIAEGTYLPTATTDRAISFILKNAVALYGGYAGFGAADPDARDIAMYPTILSGDIGKPGDKSDNSYHVVRGARVGGSTVLDGITITLSNASGTTLPQCYGGGLHLQGSSPTLANCIFAANSALDGGGMYSECSSPMLTHCSFVGNSATSGYGGGIYSVCSSPMLTTCSFAENSASSGGGMHNYRSSPTLTNCNFAGNSATSGYNSGGGMYNDYSSPTLTNCSFVGNSASYGGGMRNCYSSPMLTNCSFVGNSVTNGYGGGMYNSPASSPKLANCILWGNSSGIDNNRIDKSEPTVTYSLIQEGYNGTGNLNADPQFVRNPSPGPDGRWGTADDDYGNLRPQRASPAVNAGNNDALPAGLATDLAGNPRIRDGVVDMGAYEATESLAVVTFAAATQQVSEDAGIITVTLNLAQPIDLPVSVSLRLGGTATLDSDYRLLSPNPIVFEPGSSSASARIEILEDSLYELGETLTLNLSSLTNARFGAIRTHTITINDNDEPPVLYVDNTAKGKNDGSSWADAYTSLQAALKAVQVGAVVCVAAGTYTPGTRRAGAFSLQSHVAIYGGFPEGGGTWQQRDPSDNPTILSGEIGDPATRADNSYHVVTASRADATAILDGLTITAGCANGGYPANYGGGMCNSSSSPTINDCIFSQNSAVAGGGMYNDRSSPVLTNCTFSGNSVSGDWVTTMYGYGGGMCNSSSSPTLTNCTFRGNWASDGGGICNRAASSPILTNCVFVGNYTIGPQLNNSNGTTGGGMRNESDCSPKLTNCTFSENWADVGSGVYGPCATLTNCILWGNTGRRIVGSAESQLYGVANVTHSLIQGGWKGAGNLDADPQFARDPDSGPDGQWGTADDDWGDLRLCSASPALNAGSNDALASDLATDIAGNPRIHDGIVDLGAYEAIDWPVTVTLAASSQQVAEDAGTLTITLNLSQPLDTPVSVPLVLGGTATLGSDYRLLSPDPVVFEPGSTSISFRIEILDDSRYELSETLTLRMGELTGVWYGAITRYSITLADNDEPPVLYVDDTAKGNNDGSSWADAYTSLQSALQAVEVGAVICVAAGTYTPGALRSDSFQLRSRVAIYGGFPEGGGTWQQRNPAANPTILSGEIGDPGNTSDNSDHVVYASGVDATAILDGVTITAGNTNPGSYTGYGGGMYNVTSSSPTIRNCVFKGNSAAYGGGMYNGNKSSPTLINCVFSGNKASLEGGGMYNWSSSPTLVNCTLGGNWAQVGGGISNSYSSPKLVNCILWGNAGNQQICQSSSSTPDVTCSLVQGGFTGTGNLDVDPQFVRNPDPGLDGRWGTADDDYGDLRLCSTSPALNAGNNAALPVGIAMDSAGNPRVIGSSIDLGAYETPELPTVTFTAAAEEVSEDAGTITVTLNLSQPLEVPVSVSLRLGGNAILGSDYRLLGPDSITFEPGSTSLSFGIEILNDTRYELSETLLIHLENVTNAWYGAIATHAITILVDNDEPPVLYVDGTAKGANDGSNWADAYTSLQTALQAVDVGAVIWVAAGTYKPGTLRTDSFQLQNRVAIYGGFPEGGDTWEQRNPAANPTILSGEIGDPTKTSDNSYHVVTAEQVDATAILDGVTITGGNADNNYTASYGGGMLIDKSSSLIIRNCVFSENLAIYGGGMCTSYSSSILISNCSFSGNLAAYGGGMYNGSSSPALVNCTFSGNSATEYGGSGMCNSAATPTLANCILWGNTEPQIRDRDLSKPNISYCLVQGGFAGTGNLKVDPQFVRNPDPGSDGKWGTADDDYGDLRLRSSSPALNAGNNDALPSDITNDLAGDPRLVGERVDLGAYESPDLPSVSFAAIFQQTRENAGTVLVTLNLSRPAPTAVTVPLSLSGTATLNRDYGAVSPNPVVFEPGSTSVALRVEILDNNRYEIVDRLLSLSLGEPINAWYGGVTTHTIVIRDDNDPPPVFYVDDTAKGANDGSSWADAYTSLQTALQAVDVGAVIWMAAGTYTPGPQRTDSFQLQNHVAIYGGFPEGGGTWEQRDPVANPTILSGEIGDPSKRSDNSYHVVYADQVDATAILDGVTITGGNADASNDDSGSRTPNSAGGGVYNTGSSPTITNCTFSGNSARLGGGVYNYASHPTLGNCTFGGNSASSYGGAMYNEISAATLTGCVFNGNSAQDGGGMCNAYSSPTLANCTFSRNSSRNNGGGMYNSSSSTPILTTCTFDANTASRGGGIYNIYSAAKLTECTFSGNSASYGGGMYNTQSESSTRPEYTILANCTFSGNSAVNYGGGIANDSTYLLQLTHCDFDGNSANCGGGMSNNNTNTDNPNARPKLTDCTFTRNSATHGGGLYNASSSPAITNCAFNGDSAIDGGGIYNYDESSPVLFNCIFSGNSATNRGGGIYNEYNYCYPKLTGCTLTGNTAGSGGGSAMHAKYSLSSSPVLTSCIVWGNSGQQIVHDTARKLRISYSLIQGGWDNTGCFDADPQFVRNSDPGLDGQWGTADDDYGDLRLRSTSPAINAGGSGGTETDLAGNPRLVGGKVDVGVYEYQGDDLALAGSDGPETFYLRRSASGDLEIYPGGGPEGQPLQTIDAKRLCLTRLCISGGEGDDYFVLDFSQGNPLPGLGLSISGGAGVNRVVLLGSKAAESFALSEAQVQYGTEKIALENVQQIEFDGRGGGDALSLDGSTRVKLRDSQRLRWLSVGKNATLDLADNDLIVGATPETRQAVLAAISNAIKNARGSDGKWAGVGLTSSTAKTNKQTGLAAMLNEKAGKPILTSFNGQAVGINDILVKYTWNGDVNLDGVVDASDYFLVDSGFITQQGQYRNGDLNLDGQVDASDYFLIDSAFITQSGTLAAEVPATVEEAIMPKAAISPQLLPAPSILAQLFSTEPVL